MANMTGMHNHTKISVPGNQMFISFGSNSATFAKKGFKAFIQKNGILIMKYRNYRLFKCFKKIISIFH